MHVGKHLPVDILKTPVQMLPGTFIPERVVEPFCVRSRQLIGVAVPAQVLIAHAGEILFQGVEIILAVSGTQRHAEKAYNKPAAMLRRHADDAADVVLRICQIGQQRIEPHASKYAVGGKRLHRLKTLRRNGHPGFDPAAELIVGAGDGKPRANGGVAADFGEQGGISGAQGGFCGISRAKAMPADQLKGTFCQVQILFQRIVGIAHAAHGDDAGAALACKLSAEQLNGIFLGTDCIEVFYLVTYRTGIAVDASMAAATVEVHVPVGIKEIRHTAGNRRQQLLGLQRLHGHPFLPVQYLNGSIG